MLTFPSHVLRFRATNESSSPSVGQSVAAASLRVPRVEAGSRRAVQRRLGSGPHGTSRERAPASAGEDGVGACAENGALTPRPENAVVEGADGPRW